MFVRCAPPFIFETLFFENKLPFVFTVKENIAKGPCHQRVCPSLALSIPRLNWFIFVCLDEASSHDPILVRLWPKNFYSDEPLRWKMTKSLQRQTLTFEHDRKKILMDEYDRKKIYANPSIFKVSEFLFSTDGVTNLYIFCHIHTLRFRCWCNIYYVFCHVQHVNFRRWELFWSYSFGHLESVMWTFLV